MLILDTDHLSALDRSHTAEGRRFRNRLKPRMRDAFLSIVTVEEAFQGWISRIRREANPVDQVIW